MKAALDIIKKYLVTQVLRLAGLKAWIANIVFNVIIKKIVKWYNDLMNLLENKKEEKENLNEYKDVVNEPSKTKEDIKDAGRKFLND